MGQEAGTAKEARVLNRLVWWILKGLEHEAGPRQAVKSVSTHGVKATKDQVDGERPLEIQKVLPYHAIVARANYLAADRPDCQFAAKEVCRWMASPTDLSLKHVKRLGRYLKGKRRLVYEYHWQTAGMIDVYGDTEWAGCLKARESTSGGRIMLGHHLIKACLATQANVSLSSGEAEFYGVVKASGVGLGYVSLFVTCASASQ